MLQPAADGFSGNILLKSVEGTAKFMLKELKKVFFTNTKTKIGAMLIKKDLESIKKLLFHFFEIRVRENGF